MRIRLSRTCEAANSEVAAGPVVESSAALTSFLAQQEPEMVQVPPWFIMSKTMRGKCRRLHFAGGCFRMAGEHYREYEDHGQRCPDASLFTHRCKDCFPAGKVSELREEATAVISDSDCVSESSSASSAAALESC